MTNLGLQNIVVSNLEGKWSTIYLEDVVIANDHDGDGSGISIRIGVPIDNFGRFFD